MYISSALLFEANLKAHHLPTILPRTKAKSDGKNGNGPIRHLAFYDKKI